MFQVLVITQGRLGSELVAAARTIAGDNPNLQALELGWDDDLEAARRKIEGELARLRPSAREGVLIMTDMYGSTPFNAARDLASPGRVEIVSGVNLPMLVRLSCMSEAAERAAAARAELDGCDGADAGRDLTAAALWIEKKGRGSIRSHAGAKETSRGRA